MHYQQNHADTARCGEKNSNLESVSLQFCRVRQKTDKKQTKNQNTHKTATTKNYLHDPEQGSQ